MNPSRQNNNSTLSVGGGREATRRGNELYENEKENARAIIKVCLESGLRWCGLLAQMQSGKTMSYYLAIAEAIRLGKVEKGVIFCGSADKELKQQVEEAKKDFLNKYYNYLINEIQMDTEEAADLCDAKQDPEKSLHYKIRVVWSSGLKKFEEDPRNTFFVWEEAHFAQDKGMRTGEFLRKLGICPTGSKEELAALGSYMLTVSATPFSEITAKEQGKQDKEFVKSKPGTTYYGLKKMIEANRIRSFGVDPREGLKTALSFNFNPEKPCYAFVRIIPGVELEEVIAIAREMGWKGVQYDSKNKSIQLSDDLENCKPSVLRRAPREHTLIILKGMFRMGKNLFKKHISFVMEMAKDSTADVVLQGLLGRMCGYDEHNAIVWLHENIIEQEFVETYVNFMTDYSCLLPRKCRNLTTDADTRTQLHTIVPVQVFVSEANSLVHSDLKTALMECFQCEEVNDLNPEEQAKEIKLQVLDPRTEFAFKKLMRDNVTYQQVPEKIAESRRQQVPVNLGSGSGIRAGNLEDETHQVTVWIAHEDYVEHGIRCGDVFLDARTKCGARIQDRKTSGKEVFSGLGEEPEPEPEEVAPVVQLWEKTTITKQLLMKTKTAKGTVTKKIGKPRRKVKLVLVEG
jgi:hypothetical protein